MTGGVESWAWSWAWAYVIYEKMRGLVRGVWEKVSGMLPVYSVGHVPGLYPPGLGDPLPHFFVSVDSKGF